MLVNQLHGFRRVVLSIPAYWPVYKAVVTYRPGHGRTAARRHRQSGERA